MVVIELFGGGQGDGQVIEVYSISNEINLHEMRCGDGFFWAYLHRLDPDSPEAQIYIEGHPHDEPDFLPPRKLELWYTNQLSAEDFK
jgi:hypothetical protein